MELRKICAVCISSAVRRGSERDAGMSLFRCPGVRSGRRRLGPFGFDVLDRMMREKTSLLIIAERLGGGLEAGAGFQADRGMFDGGVLG